MGQAAIDHRLLQDTILNNGGIIIGGYVRAWVINGYASNDGWDDVDCFFPTNSDYQNAKLELQNKFGDDCPKIDVRYMHTFNDFYCNCWKYDGEIKLMEPALSLLTFDELKEETIAKQARCIASWWWSSRLPYRVKKLIKRGFTILHPDKTPVASSILARL